MEKETCSIEDGIFLGAGKECILALSKMKAAAKEQDDKVFMGMMEYSMTCISIVMKLVQDGVIVITNTEDGGGKAVLKMHHGDVLNG